MSNNSSQDIPIGRSPKRELQGPRPTPLRINKDSHKIKKPPLAPPPQAPPRQPVIIYTVSPKVIHTTPSDFMSLVQRLTGSSSSSNKTTTNTTNVTFNHIGYNDNNDNNDVTIMSTATAVAVEMVRTTQSISKNIDSGDAVVGGVDVIGHGVLERANMFHGILSPEPSSLSPIPSNFFSPPSSDPNMVSFFHDLSPVLHSNKNFMEGSFIIPSPSNFVSPRTPSIDLFNIFSDN
ncbi:hypothetical protein VNO78_30751 [Psophocarpus tetragonolobus]|uniref:VQ domain-containing protein n=1 Tax=Psophocarpus tetragonolobus TaxID=3891 RepID=A0AAN9RYJ2_PSOTE